MYAIRSYYDAGNMLALPGMVLALSSMWTLIPAAAALIIAVIRTVLEDQTLQDELPGYRDYARRVPPPVGPCPFRGLAMLPPRRKAC